MLMTSTKQALAAGFVLFAFSQQANGQDPVEKSLERLVGRVSTVRTETVTFSYVSGKPEKGPPILSSKQEYDPNRNLTRSISYSPDGSISHEWTPLTSPDEERGFMGCSTCDQVTEFRIKHEYDNKGRETKESHYTMKGDLIRYREYLYDSAGNRIEERDYNNASLENRDVHSYDQEQNKTSTTRYGHDGKPNRKWDYRYDAKRNLTEIVSYNSDGSISGATRYYGYDRPGNVVEEAYYDDGDKLSSKANYSYQYDSAGNWIRRITHTTSLITRNIFGPREVIFEGVTEIVYRTITYY